jgi:signal transduction histidine kinase
VFGRQVRQLARLVDDLLDIGRITSGKVQLRFAPIDFGQFVE